MVKSKEAEKYRSRPRKSRNTEGLICIRCGAVAPEGAEEGKSFVCDGDCDGVFSTAGRRMIQLTSEETTQGTKAPKEPKQPRVPREPEAPGDCHCGCGGKTKSAKSSFIPGHDAKLHALLRKVELGAVDDADIPEIAREHTMVCLQCGRVAQKHESGIGPACRGVRNGPAKSADLSYSQR